MKKHFYILVCCVLIVGFGLVFFHEGKSASAKSASSGFTRTATTATDSSESATRDSSPAPIAPSTRIPIIDGTNPNYAQAISTLERSFIRLLERDALTQNLPAERTVALGNRLAVLRLSQTMYEATIASVTKNGDDVKISIPAYSREGESLQNMILTQMFPELDSKALETMLRTRFGFFGKFPQEIDVKRDAAVENGEKMYSISHLYQFTDGSGILRGESTLPPSRLGYYMPFQVWFPSS